MKVAGLKQLPRLVLAIGHGSPRTLFGWPRCFILLRERGSRVPVRKIEQGIYIKVRVFAQLRCLEFAKVIEEREVTQSDNAADTFFYLTTDSQIIKYNYID